MTNDAQNRIAEHTSRLAPSDRGIASLIDRHRLNPTDSDAARDDSTRHPVEFVTHRVKFGDVYEDLKRQLGWEFSSDALFFTSARRLERNYDEAYAKLDELKKRTATFIRQVVHNAPNEFRDLTLGAYKFVEAQQAMEELLSEYTVFDPGQIPPPRSLALSGGGDKNRLHRVYSQHFHCEIDNLVQNLFSHLDRMQKRGIVGTAQYAGTRRNRHCQFTTFHSVAKANQSAKTTSVSEQRTVSPTSSLRTTTRRVTTFGTYVLQHVHSAYLLREVTCTPLLKWNKPVPERIARVFRNMPPYLVPFMTVTDGFQRDGISVAKDVAEIPWSYVEEKVTVRHDLTYDPFLSFGPFVLAYWPDGEFKISQSEWNQTRRLIGK
jgi:hypothetical protein